MFCVFKRTLTWRRFFEHPQNTFWLYIFFLESSDDNQSMKNYPACVEGNCHIYWWLVTNMELEPYVKIMYLYIKYYSNALSFSFQENAYTYRMCEAVEILYPPPPNFQYHGVFNSSYLETYIKGIGFDKENFSA